MRARRVAGILLIVGLIGGALAGFRGGREWESASELAAYGAAEKHMNSVGEELKGSGPGGHSLTRTDRGGLLVAARKVREATVEESAAVAEMCELQLMANGTGLELAPEQWATLAEVTLRTQAVRRALEAEIGEATPVAPGRWRMDVPGYPAAGASLRAKFYAELGTALGEGVAAEVIDRLGAALEAHFAGFGVSLQTLEIVGEPRGRAEAWEVTRTVMYSKDAMSGERVAVRRETYFAGREDPVWERLKG